MRPRASILRRRRAIITGGGAADPVAFTGGVVKGWLRNTTVGAVSSWVDQLNSNPATQATGGNQPIGGADFSITPDGSDDFLSWPTVAGINNATTQQGFAFWLKPRSTLASFQFHFGAQGTNARYGFYNNGGGNGFRFDVHDAGGAARHFDTPNGSISLNTPVFVTVECPLASADDIAITLNGVVQTLTLSSGSAITALKATTAAHQFHRRNDNSLPSPAVFGRNFYALQGVMPGASAGRMLTAAATSALMGIDPLS
jgi:hypothetical protein